MLSSLLLLLWTFHHCSAAQIGDLIMQDLGVKAYENTVSTATFTSLSSLISQPSMDSTSNSLSIPTSTLPVHRLNTTLPHTLPSTGIVPTSAPTGSARDIHLGRTLVNSPIADWDIGHGTGPLTGQGTGTLICQNCSTFGDLFFSTSGFKSISNNSSQLEHLENLRAGSFFTSFHGAGGTMQFKLTADGTLSDTVAFINIPTPIGYVIPGLGTVGLTLAMAIPVSLTAEVPVDMTFGFSYTIPDDAFVNVTLGTLEDSHAYGFTFEEGLQLHNLPFELHTTNVDLILSASLKTSLNLGFTFLNKDIYASAGIFIDTPGMSIDISQTPTCNNSTSTKRSSFLFSNATEISPAIGLDLGVNAEFGISGYHTFDQAATLVQASFDLPKTCLPNLPLGPFPTGIIGSTGLISALRFPAITTAPSQALPSAWLTSAAASSTSSVSSSSRAPNSMTAQTYITSTSLMTTAVITSPPSTTANAGQAQHDASLAALVLLPFAYGVLSTMVDMW